MVENPLVFIIVLNYKNYNLTYECISSLSKLTYSNYHILVVDDYSVDTSIYNIVHDFKNVSLIRNEKNLNYC